MGCLTLTNCNKVGCSLFWKFSPIQRQYEHKNFFTDRFQNNQLSSAADTSQMGHISHVAQLVTLKLVSENFFWCLFGHCMGEKFQKSEPPPFLQFVRVRVVHQTHGLRRKLFFGMTNQLILPPWCDSAGAASRNSCQLCVVMDDIFRFLSDLRMRWDLIFDPLFNTYLF